MGSINRLSNLKVRTATCPEGKPAIMLNDGGGLLLRVASTGGKSWVYRYMRNGKTHDLGLGSLNTISQAEAREAALECRKLRLAGNDPLKARRAERQRQLPTFEDFAEEYIDRQAPKWTGKRTAEDWRNTMRQHVFPQIGKQPIDEIDTRLVVRAIEPLWAKTPEQGRRTLNRVETILTAARAAGHRDLDAPNPAAWEIMKHLLPAPPAGAEEHHESMDYREVPAFLRSLEGQRGDTARALRFLILTGVRKGAVIEAAWEEFDLEKRVWTIPVARMKRKEWGDFKVPLSEAAVTVLRDTPRVGPRPFPIAAATMLMFLSRLGLKATVHGFRSSFSTWAAEETDFPDEIREACLAHFTGNKVAAAYQRGDLLAKRRRLMDRWGQFCCPSEGEAEVVQLRA
jgi:integrase